MPIQIDADVLRDLLDDDSLDAGFHIFEHELAGKDGDIDGADRRQKVDSPADEHVVDEQLDQP